MRIGVVAPASIASVDIEPPAEAFAAIAYPDVELVFHPQCWEVDGHFAGSDARRAQAFVEVANDPAIDAVWAIRGGYGSNRLIEAIMPALNDAARHKMYVGYSDIGFLLAALYARGIGRPAHGPMPVDIRRQGGDRTVGRALGWMTARDRQGLEPGLDGRPAIALNLSILGALIGSKWLPDLTDHVLMIEEVSEPMYNVDRLLWHLAEATQLKGVAGVRLGSVTDVKENIPAWEEPLEAMIARWCKVMEVPYLGRALIGHNADNHVVPFGIT